MSLYSDVEICEGCIHACFYDCGNCLEKCWIKKEDKRDFVSGNCEYKEDGSGY